MATKKWKGTAPAVAQVDTIEIGGTIEAGDKFRVTINGQYVQVAATTTSAATTATELYTALAASTIPEFLEITWTNPSSGIVRATGKTAGVPFTATVSTTEGDDGAADAQTITLTATTACSGPNWWSVAANWDSAAVPVNSDDVIIENSTIDILYGLDQSAVTLTSLTIMATYTGKIGLPVRNANGYYEYRDTYLKISSTTIRSGEGSGSGSPRIKLNVGTVATTVIVTGTGTSTETGVPAFLWKGTHASNVLNVTKGTVGVAFFAGETATIATGRVGYVANATGDADVTLGSGCTLTTLEQSGSTLTVNSNFTTLTKTDGTTTVQRAATATTLNLEGGATYWQSSGTITTANVGDGATLSFERDMRARTVTNCNLYSGGTITDPSKTVTWTNGVDLERCAIGDVTLNLGVNLKLTPAAVS